MHSLYKDDAKLLKEAGDWLGSKPLHHLSEDVLGQLTKSKGVDFASAALYHAIRFSKEHGPANSRLEAIVRDAKSTSVNLGVFADAFDVVPGAFYREHPNTGADGKNLCRTAARFGCRTHVIPTLSMGSSATNARIMCDWLLATTDERIILCSLSKGGADVLSALDQPDAKIAFKNVVAWLNVGGITRGSPTASWVLERAWLSFIYRAIFWWRGQDFNFIRELRRGTHSQPKTRFEWPATMKVFHVVGLPLTQHLCSRRTRRWHQRLSRYGPNDGVTIVTDNCDLPGVIFPVWGADHYFNGQLRPEVLLDALLQFLYDEFREVTSSARARFLAPSIAAS
jgi:hypothetical protein